MRYIEILFLLPIVLSVPYIEGIREITVFRNSTFLVGFNVSYISDGKIEIHSPDCIEIGKREYKFGKVYGEVPFYIYGRVHCNPGLYFLRITATSNGDSNEWEVPMIVFGDVKVKKFGNCLEMEGWNFCDKACFLVGDKEICSRRICFPDEKEVKVFCEFYGKRIEKNVGEWREFQEIKIIDGDVSDGIIEIELGNGDYCFEAYPPLYIEEKCLRSEGRVRLHVKVVEETNKTRFSLRVKKVGSGWEEYISVYRSCYPEIKLYYSSIDFERRKVRVVVSNEGECPARSVKVIDRGRVFYIERLGKGEWKLLELPYRDKIELKVIYKKGLKAVEENHTIIPEFVIFEEKENPLLKIFALILVLFLIILVLRKIV